MTVTQEPAGTDCPNRCVRIVGTSGTSFVCNGAKASAAKQGQCELTANSTNDFISVKYSGGLAGIFGSSTRAGHVREVEARSTCDGLDRVASGSSLHEPFAILTDMSEQSSALYAKLQAGTSGVAEIAAYQVIRITRYLLL